MQVMHSETFEQTEIPTVLLGGQAQYLQVGSGAVAPPPPLSTAACCSCRSRVRTRRRVHVRNRMAGPSQCTNGAAAPSPTLQDGMTIQVEAYQGVPAIVTLPSRVTFTIASLEETSGSAVTDKGFRIRVPKHVKVGDRVIVDTNSGIYVSKE
jgi:hypothetical protein